jgi:hypothetical protein
MTTFEGWLRTECFQKPTDEAYELAKAAWKFAEATEKTRPIGSARMPCSDAEPFYLGTGNLEGTDLEMSWHMVGTADGDITAMFRTWAQAEEYLKFVKG